MIAISLISVIMLLILAVIATYLSVKDLLRWKKIELDTAKARVFLDKSFLNINFKLTLAVVGLVFIHFILMEYVQLTGFPLQGLFKIFYFGFFLGSILALIWLVYIWHKLLRKNKYHWEVHSFPHFFNRSILTFKDGLLILKFGQSKKSRNTKLKKL